MERKLKISFKSFENCLARFITTRVVRSKDGCNNVPFPYLDTAYMLRNAYQMHPFKCKSGFNGQCFTDDEWLDKFRISYCFIDDKLHFKLKFKSKTSNRYRTKEKMIVYLKPQSKG